MDHIKFTNRESFFSTVGNRAFAEDAVNNGYWCYERECGKLFRSDSKPTELGSKSKRDVVRVCHPEKAG